MRSSLLSPPFWLCFVFQSDKNMYKYSHWWYKDTSDRTQEKCLRWCQRDTPECHAPCHHRDAWPAAYPLSPWRQWLVVTGRPPLSPPLHCTVGQEAVFYNVCVSCGDVEWRNVSIPPRMNNRTSRTLCVIGRQKNQRLILINWYFPEVTDKRQSVN